MKKNRNRTLPPEEFVIVWNKSRSLDEFLQRTGMSRFTARNRVARFRKMGVKMKFMGPMLRNAERLREVQELAEAIADPWDFDEVLDRYK